MTENNDASWHAWTDNDDDDDEDDPEPCQVQLFIAQGRCQTVDCPTVLLPPPLLPPCCRQMCIVFSAERRIRLSFSYRFGHVSSCCCRCLINLKLYECCRRANVASILLQFTQLPPPVYRPLSLAPKPKRAESVSTKRENFPKAKNETEREWSMRSGQVCQPNYFSLSQI